MKPSVFIVIPNWNGKHLLPQCLDSLEKQSLSAKIVAVDNGSSDGSVEFIKQNYPNVHLIELAKNIGFTGGVNTGINWALSQTADYIALFNNDAVADKNWLESLVDVLNRQDKVGIVTCKLLRSDKKHFDSTGDQYSVFGLPFPRSRNVEDTGQFNKAEFIFSASGGASLYRSELFKQIGVFDQKFFAYYEDVDLSFRAHLAGWKVYYQPDAVVYHEVNATSSRLGSFSRYHATKNFFMLYTKDMPGWLYWKYLPKFLYQALRLAASSFIKGGGWAYLRGLVQAFINLPAILLDRWQIQKNRKISSADIDALLYKQRPPKIPKLS
jgi:GT2 family glycosyltransferase